MDAKVNKMAICLLVMSILSHKFKGMMHDIGNINIIYDPGVYTTRAHHHVKFNRVYCYCYQLRS